MAFITASSKNIKYNNKYNAIFLTLDKLSKVFHYISCCLYITADKLVEVIIQAII